MRTRQLPIATPFLSLRPLAADDAAKIFQMIQEEGMRAWLPSQVYRDEADAALVIALSWPRSTRTLPIPRLARTCWAYNSEALVSWSDTSA